MMENYTYTCVVYALLFLLAWTIVYALSRRARTAMIWTGLAFAPAAVIGELWHLKDYWSPTYIAQLRIGAWRFGGIEDYVFGFALAGISAGVFEILTLRQGLPALPRISLPAYLRMAGFGLIGLSLMVVSTALLHLRSMHTATVAIVLTALLMFVLRPEVAPRALLTALAFAGFFWFFYAGIIIPLYPGMIGAFWMPSGNLGIRLAGVPLEEVVWGFSASLFAGPVFRVCSTTKPASAKNAELGQAVLGEAVTTTVPAVMGTQIEHAQEPRPPSG
jgi:hypothetical protein